MATSVTYSNSVSVSSAVTYSKLPVYPGKKVALANASGVSIDVRKNGRVSTILPGSHVTYAIEANAAEIEVKLNAAGNAAVVSFAVGEADVEVLAAAKITFLSGSATWDPANMAADGDVVTTNVTVTGAAVGDFVVATFPIGTNNVLISAHVSAANTVRVVLQNKTGGALDLASGTLAVRVLKIAA